LLNIGLTLFNQWCTVIKITRFFFCNKACLRNRNLCSIKRNYFIAITEFFYTNLTTDFIFKMSEVAECTFHYVCRTQHCFADNVICDYRAQRGNFIPPPEHSRHRRRREGPIFVHQANRCLLTTGHSL